MNELQKTKLWFQQAMPNPTIEQATKQLGCHMEEFTEMMQSIGYSGITEEMESVAESFKASYAHQVGSVDTCNTEALLDAIIDQIVTAIGVCHTMGFDVEGALSEVNRSNFSKFEDGKPVFYENGKIAKGKDYTPPNLGDFI